MTSMKQKSQARGTASPEQKAHAVEVDAVDLRPRQVHKLGLDTVELVHLRDLFSVLLPPAADKSISQVLAASASRPFTEARLWNKIQALCTATGVPVGDAAPDFIVTIAAAPELTVFQIEREVAATTPDENVIGAVLSALDENDETAVVTLPAKKRTRRAKKEEA